jgi:ubiquinone/menaquinone biosynthesis C-methylase UbiE
MGLENNSIDVVICFDVMHDIEDKNMLLKEFHRVLKPNGYLSFDDHHYSEDEILKIFSSGELFELEEQIDKIYNFKKKVLI